MLVIDTSITPLAFLCHSHSVSIAADHLIALPRLLVHCAMTIFPPLPLESAQAVERAETSRRPAMHPLSMQLKRLHALNAERLQELEGRLQCSVQQQKEWVMEQNRLLSHIEQQRAELMRLHIRVEEHSEGEAALERTISVYHRQVVDLQSEYSADVESMERRCCELQVELGEWKETAEAEHLQRCTAEEELAKAQHQRDELQLTVEVQRAEIQSLSQQVDDVQQLLLLSTGEHSSAESNGFDDQTASGWRHPRHALPSISPSLLCPSPLPARLHSFPFPLSSSSPSASPSSLYEELVDLHEAVHSLRQQLHAAEAVAAQSERRAVEAEGGVLPLQLQVHQLSAEVKELRLLCGDVEERERITAALEVECRQEVRMWRLQQEEDFARRWEERADQRERERKEEEEREAHNRRQLAASVDECAAVVQELASMLASQVSSSSSGRSSSALHPPVPTSDASARPPTAVAMESVRVLKQLRSSILDQRARVALQGTECNIQ